MFNNTENIQAGPGANNQPELDGQSKMGEELETQKALFCASSRESLSYSVSELTSVSSNWQTPLIWITLSLPFLALLLQLVWEHMGDNSQLTDGPILPLGLAWYLITNPFLLLLLLSCASPASLTPGTC